MPTKLKERKKERQGEQKKYESKQQANNHYQIRNDLHT